MSYYLISTTNNSADDFDAGAQRLLNLIRHCCIGKDRGYGLTGANVAPDGGQIGDLWPA